MDNPDRIVRVKFSRTGAGAYPVASSVFCVGQRFGPVRWAGASCGALDDGEIGAVRSRNGGIRSLRTFRKSDNLRWAPCPGVHHLDVPVAARSACRLSCCFLSPACLSCCHCAGQFDRTARNSATSLLMPVVGPGRPIMRLPEERTSATRVARMQLDGTFTVSAVTVPPSNE